jgi:hypothetical protein
MDNAIELTPDLLADPLKVTTRAQAEARVRHFSARCRGPHRLSVDRTVDELHIAIERERDVKAAHRASGGVDEDLPAPRLGIDHEHAWFTPEKIAQLKAHDSTKALQTTLMEEGQDKAATLVDAAARGAGCGYDVNNIIATLPFDGRRYIKETEKIDNRIACPACGLLLNVTAPSYPNLTDDIAARLPMPTLSPATE